jgi:MMPL family
MLSALTPVITLDISERRMRSYRRNQFTPFTNQKKLGQQTAYRQAVTAALASLPRADVASLGATLPWMALLTGVSTFVLLFLAFGSVVLPVKAIVMNVLSLSATFGVVVWIFQWGHLSGLLQFTPTGSIDPTMPILMLAVIFGLSMDYEVFLLSRIRERYDQTGDNTAAVASGLQRTGGLITSLALLLIVVVGAFSASGITFIKLMGVGMIVALLVDATVIRVLLVPATMRLLGRANWWAPRPLRRLYAGTGSRKRLRPNGPGFPSNHPPRPGGRRAAQRPARAFPSRYSSHRDPTGGRCQPAGGVTENEPARRRARSDVGGPAGRGIPARRARGRRVDGRARARGGARAAR